MDNEIIALRWNNHLSTLSQMLHSLREEEYLSDVSLACDGKIFRAHKFVLSMCSDFFKEMFTSTPCKHPVVFLKDVKHEDMDFLLDFMYKGVVHIQQDALTDLLDTAEGLRIRGLSHFAQDISMASSTPIGASHSDPLEPSLLMTELRRPLESGHGPSLLDFPVDDFEEIKPKPAKKLKKEHISCPPAAIPELPVVSDGLLDFGGGIHISAEDYYKFRRTNINRYINDLLRYFFPVEILASSSLTGGVCFANKSKSTSSKNQIDPVTIRVITHDAIRNFQNVTEKQVRNAIRRKLNTESRLFRGLTKSGQSSRMQENSKIIQSPRMDVSIEKAEVDMDEAPSPTSLITPNVTLEKSSSSEGRSPGSSSFFSSEKTRPDTERSQYFNSGCPERTSSPLSGDMSNQHVSGGGHSSSPTPAGSNSSVPSSSPSPVPSCDKSFDVVKTECSPSQYPTASQEYPYPAIVPGHYGQMYFPHHLNDPSYLRRLDLGQGANYPPYGYPSSVQDSDSVEQPLHM